MAGLGLMLALAVQATAAAPEPGATASAAAVPAAVAAAPAKPAEPKKVCVVEAQLGSHFKKKVCATEAEWEARRLRDADVLARSAGGKGPACTAPGC